MAWQCILGLIVMVAGFAGVLVCAKIQKTNPTIQPLAMVCAAVMLIGLGLYFWFYLNPPNYAAEYNRIYNLSVAHTMGTKLQGKKVIWIASGINGEDFKAKQAVMEKALGSSVTVVEASDPESGIMMDDKKFEEILKGADATTVLLIDADVSGLSKLAKQLGNAKGPKFVFTEMASQSLVNFKNVKTAFDKEIILFAIVAAMNDEEFTPDEDNLDEAFQKRYIIIDKNNFDSSKDKLGFL